MPIQSWIRVNLGVWNFFSGFKGGLVLGLFGFRTFYNTIQIRPWPSLFKAADNNLTRVSPQIQGLHETPERGQAICTSYYKAEIETCRSMYFQQALGRTKFTWREVLLRIFVGREKQPKRRTIFLFATPSFLILPLPSFSLQNVSQILGQITTASGPTATASSIMSLQTLSNQVSATGYICTESAYPA